MRNWVIVVMLVLRWSALGQAQDMTFLDCRDIRVHARYLVEHMPSAVETWPQLSTAICTPCSCPMSMASCYAYMAEQEKAKEQNAQALEAHRETLRTLLDRCEALETEVRREKQP